MALFFPLLNLISKWKSAIFSCSLLNVLVCTVVSFSSGLWSVCSTKAVPLM